MGVERGLRVEVEVPGDERISTLAVFKDLEGCLALPAAVCRLIGMIGVICDRTGWRVLHRAGPAGVVPQQCRT